MISPGEIRDRARRLWTGGRALRASLGAEPLFPYSVPFRRPSAREWLENFAQLRDAAERLEAGSKTGAGAGYTVIYKATAHQRLGQLRAPERIVFESVDDVAACAGEIEALRRFRVVTRELLSREPGLIEWVKEQPLRVLERESALPRLLAAVEFFRAHPRPMRYARELSIPGGGTKFIEEHRVLLGEWLERLLPADALDGAVRGLADHGFERRFGLRYEEPLIRFRWLDPMRTLEGRISDAAVPLSQFIAYAARCSRVFVTENKINFLTLPASADALAIFGGGYAIDRLAGIAWLREVAVHYWGDIDPHGFAILSRLRGYLPEVHSFLMDRDTLMAHRTSWSDEPRERRCLHDLPGLGGEEHSLYDDLRHDRIAECVRLEQERIAYAHVAEAVRVAEKAPHVETHLT